MDGFAVTLRGLAVLVVDDDPDACWTLGTILKIHGATVHTAGSVAEALELRERHVPEVLVSDLKMPIRDGHDLIREIRRFEGASRRMPAIAVTGCADADDRARAVENGFDLVLEKPVQPQRLLESIARLNAATQS